MTIENRKTLFGMRIPSWRDRSIPPGPITLKEGDHWTGDPRILPPHVLNKVIVASVPFLPEEDMTVGRLTVVDADSLTIGIVNVGVGVILDPPLILSGEEINRANLQTPIDELTGEKIIWKPSKRK